MKLRRCTKAIYSFYAYCHGAKLMQMEGFVMCCEQCALIGGKTGVSKRECKLVYAWQGALDNKQSTDVQSPATPRALARLYEHSP
jgi:hypothetical protein